MFWYGIVSFALNIDPQLFVCLVLFYKDLQIFREVFKMKKFQGKENSGKKIWWKPGSEMKKGFIKEWREETRQRTTGDMDGEQYSLGRNFQLCYENLCWTLPLLPAHCASASCFTFQSLGFLTCWIKLHNHLFDSILVLVNLSVLSK